MYTWALFSAHNSFSLDLRSFWLFMLTWVRERAFVSWRTGIYTFFPGKYAHNFGFKMYKLKKCQKRWVMPTRLFCMAPRSLQHLFNWCGFKMFLRPFLCFSWSNVLHSNQAAAQQQEAVGSMIPNIHGKRKTCSKPPTSYRMAPPQL